MESLSHLSPVYKGMLKPIIISYKTYHVSVTSTLEYLHYPVNTTYNSMKFAT